MDLQTAFRKKYKYSPSIFSIAPGTVNLLGEHVDYNEGIVLPMAIDRYAYFAARPTENEVLDLYAVDYNEAVQIPLNNLGDKNSVLGEPIPAWAKYPAGVAWALQEAGYRVSGAQIAYSSTVPVGSGLSSSAAVEIGFSIICQALGDWKASPLDIAMICQRAENHFVGVASRLMDQFASACGVENHILHLDTRNLTWGTAPMLEDVSIIIADSGIKQDLADSAYNDRRRSCEEAVSKLHEYLPGINSLRDVSPTEFAAFGYYLPDEVRKRAEHVIKEIARVESAINALKRNDYTAFGALMYAGHRSLRDLYEVSTPELDVLIETAHDIPGCIGAKLTGAGFGGCTVNFVKSSFAEDFIHQLQDIYTHRTGRNIQVFDCKASQGAHLTKA